MGFSFLSGLAGGADAIRAGWKEDRQAQALKKASMLQIVLPEAMKLRNKRRDKKDKFKVLFRKLQNYLPNNNALSFGLLESGEDYTNEWIKKVEGYRAQLPKGKDLSDLKVLKAAGMIDKDYVPPEEVPNFEDWWTNTMVGRPGDHADPKQERSLKSAMEKQFGIMSDASIRSEVYGDAATAIGGKYADVWSDITGTRIKDESGFTKAIRLPETELDKLQWEYKKAELVLGTKVFNHEAEINGKKMPYAIALEIGNLNNINAQTNLRNANAEYYRAGGSKSGKGATSYDKFLNKRLQVANEFTKVIGNKLGFTYEEVEGKWRVIPQGTENEKRRLDVVSQATNYLTQSWGDRGAKVYVGGGQPFHSIADIISEISSPTNIDVHIAMATAYLDASSKIRNRGSGKEYFKATQPSILEKQMFTESYDNYYLKFSKELSAKGGSEEDKLNIKKSEELKTGKPKTEELKTGKLKTEEPKIVPPKFPLREKGAENLGAVIDAIQAVTEMPDHKPNVVYARDALGSYIEWAIENDLLNVEGIKDKSVDDILEDADIGKILTGRKISLMRLLSMDPEALKDTLAKINIENFSGERSGGGVSTDEKSFNPKQFIIGKPSEDKIFIPLGARKQ